MNKLAAVKTETRIGRPLKVLVPLIQEELEAGNRAGLEHYRHAGEMLLEARDQVAQYRWGTWLSKNFELSRWTAQRYMQLAVKLRERPDLGAGQAPSSMHTIIGRNREAPAHTRTAAWRSVAAAAREIDRELFGQERQTQHDEVRLHREIAVELIDLGYRALATRLHPDTGGSKDAMRRLNRVRDDLKSLASQRRFV